MRGGIARPQGLPLPQSGGYITRPVPAGRVFALDNLRAALVVLVVLHSASLVYSGFAPFYYEEPPLADPAAVVVLGLFALINQAWFMSALFFIAGYFTPDSYDRRGARDFVRGRLLRLGVPLVIGMLVVEPIARIGLFLMPSQQTGITTPLSWAAYPEMIGLGPLWFVAMLLVFSLLYALWRKVIGNSIPPTERRSPTPWEVRLAVLALALCAYFWRMLVPIGQDVSLYGEMLSFPTIAYLPHYILTFIVGILAKRNRWLPGVRKGEAWQGVVASVIATIVFLPWALSGSVFLLGFSPGAEFTGHGTWQSALYALWDATLAVGLLTAVLALFTGLLTHEGPVWRFFARQSYATYLTHIVVVTFVGYGLSGLAWPALLKFLLLALIAVPVAFGLAYAIRLIPGVKRVV